jgi:hypothetical protein
MRVLRHTRPKPVAAPPTTVKSSGTTTCHVNPVATSRSGAELSTSSAPPRFNKIHSLCYGKAKKSCGVVVNAATSDIAHSHFLFLAALSRISAWQESIPSIADLPAAILTTAHLSSDPFTVQRAAAHNITLVAVAQQSMDPSATSTLAHPSHVYALSPYEFTVLVNASYNFFPRAATGRSGTQGTNRYPPAVASLHLLEFFDVLAPPLPRWDEPSVSDAMHAARVAAYGEAADGVRITTQLHHPAVLLYRASALVHVTSCSDGAMRTVEGTAKQLLPCDHAAIFAGCCMARAGRLFACAGCRNVVGATSHRGTVLLRGSPARPRRRPVHVRAHARQGASGHSIRGLRRRTAALIASNYDTIYNIAVIST